VVVLRLPARRTGRFTVVVTSERALEAAGDEALVVRTPLVRPVGIEEFTRTLWTATSGGWVPRVDDAAWEPATTVRDETAWTTEERPASVAVRLERVEATAGGDLTVRRALVRTLVSGDGVNRTWSRFDVSGATSPLIVTLPEGVTADEFLWNGRVLTRDEVLASPPGSNRYSLSVGRGGEGLLLVRTHATGGAVLGWSDVVTARAPSLPGATWVEQTVWQVSLPDEQYVFAPPGDFAANYDWRRAPVFFQRVPRAGFADPVAWIGDRSTRAEEAEFEGRNSYQFLGLGPRSSIALRTASRSCLVLFGAGLALALGFVLLKIPTLRHVLVLLGLGFVLALLSLWFPEPVLVLLQPALLGLVLALTAALIDSAFSREPVASPVLSFPTPLDGSSGVLHEASTRSEAGIGGSSSGSRSSVGGVEAREPVSSSAGVGS
jgi:hypothetical protein